MDWTDDLIARLRDLWSQGLSTAEIGRQLSITKNAVVGKAHRLGLPPRPSPIRNKAVKDGEVAVPARRKPPTKRVKKVKETAEGQSTDKDAAEAGTRVKNIAETKKKAEATQKALFPEPKNTVKARLSEGEKRADVKKPVSKKEGKTTKIAAAKTAPTAVVKPIVRPKRVRDIMERPLKRGPSCQWPLGDPGTPEFHFCGATPLPGKPYCAEHAAIAYVRIRDRRDG
ncbi:GcrA cell cycle regulator [Aristophania vespae]|uniref:GcrA cell cycle regulator n=1 Tax=Aristophania vespae TaxID=2697033 RepID=A0A6P1NHH4_9PROT|nr:GcrA family cell cycle regulator [Aristophania vespae]QHI95112.1 GcrA cell cycle regulator [Aristophania vespae]UMM64320.1 hypothetical protein DM15PD_13320 [Aristophania vespae]